MTTFAPRTECTRCKRPQVTCYCPHLPQLESRSRVLVLQHPRERDKAVGTAHMASLCLPHSQVAVGVDFSHDESVQTWLADPRFPAVLLYPGNDAIDLDARPPSWPVTLVVIDGTWHQARALLRRNPGLLSLPHYAFRPPRPSEYRIRREPRSDYVSTIEALALAMGALEGDRLRFEALLRPFRAMVDAQLAYAAQSTRGRHRERRRRDARTPARLPPLLAEGNLLCVGGEANAWPHDRAIGKPPYAHELVHWVAFRPSDGSFFETLIAPRKPLSRAPLVHARLSESELRAGCSVSDFAERFRSFVRPDDVICSWGEYATGLFEAEGLSLGERRVDIRKVVGDLRKQRPGSLEDFIAAAGIDHVARGRGRTGERLGMLAAVTEQLALRARATPDPDRP